MAELKEQKIIKLSDRDHVLRRPNLYLGSVSMNIDEGYFLENDKFAWKQMEYVPALLKIINEIVDNSVDEAIRTNFKHATKVDINIEDNSITILDNGRGLPINVNPKNDDEQQTFLAFCHAKAGSNFGDDDSRTTGGMNGCGSFLVNTFSTKFNVETSNGKHKLKLKCKDNFSSHSMNISETSGESYTEVYFEPDLKRFGITDNKIPQVYVDLIKQRLVNLSMTYPLIRFRMNKEIVKVKTPSKFVELFGNEFEILEEDNGKYFVAILPNSEDDMRFYSSCNGLSLKEGGSHIQLISTEITNVLREKISKKYKEIKPGDIKNKMLFIVFFNEFKNMRFDSQTKVKLTNSITELNSYLGQVDWDKFAMKIYKNEKITDPIVETFKIKEEFKHRQELKSLNKGGNKKIVNDKYLAPIENKKYLVLAEGFSASSGICSVLGRKDFGYYALKGKPLNTLEVAMSKIADNEEFRSIIEILGLDMTNPNTGMTYEQILIASDNDGDGIMIRFLLLAFFNKFTPKLLKEGKICFLQTPLLVGYKSKKPVKLFYNLNEYANNKEKFDSTFYAKGLGTWKKEQLVEIFKLYGLENFIMSFSCDKNYLASINKWLSKDTSDMRKEELRGKSFDIERS